MTSTPISPRDLPRTKSANRLSQLNAATAECRRSARLSASNGHTPHGVRSTKLDSGFFSDYVSQRRSSQRGSYADDGDVQIVRSSQGEIVKGDHAALKQEEQIGRCRDTSLDSDGGDAASSVRPHQMDWLRRQMGGQGSSERSLKSTKLDSGFFNDDDNDVDGGDTPRGACRVSISDLEPPPQHAVGGEDQRQSMQVAQTTQGGSRGHLEHQSSGTSKGLRSARMDGSFFNDEASPAPPPSLIATKSTSGSRSSILSKLTASCDGAKRPKQAQPRKEAERPLQTVQLDDVFFSGCSSRTDSSRRASCEDLANQRPSVRGCAELSDTPSQGSLPSLGKSSNAGRRRSLDNFRDFKLSQAMVDSLAPAPDVKADVPAPGPISLTRGKSSPSLCSNTGGPLAMRERRKSRMLVESPSACSSPGSSPGPKTASFTRKSSSNSVASSDEGGTARKKGKEVKFDRPTSTRRAGSEWGAAVGVGASAQVRPSLLKRQASAPALGSMPIGGGELGGGADFTSTPRRGSLSRQLSSSDGLGGVEPSRRASCEGRRGSLPGLQRKGSARELYSGGSMPDGTASPRSNAQNSDGFVQRQQGLISTNL